MKRWLLGTGLVLLAVGVAFSLAGRFMGGDTELEVRMFGTRVNVRCLPLSAAEFVSVRTADEYAHNESNLSLDEFQSLDIDLSLGDVEVLPGDYGVELDWQGKGYQISYTNENGTLKIWNSSEPSINMMGDYVGRVTVYVPDGTVLERVDISADLGEVVLENVQMHSADLNLDLGSLTCTNVTVDKKLTVEADLGDVEFWGDLRGETGIEASLGSVTLNLTGPASGYSYDVDVSLGEISIDGREYDKERLAGGRGENTIQVQADLGSVELNFGV